MGIRGFEGIIPSDFGDPLGSIPCPESRKPYEPARIAGDTMSPRRDTMIPRDEWRLYP